MEEKFWAGKTEAELRLGSMLFSVLCRDYTSVYFVDLLTGEAEMFKIDAASNAKKMFKDAQVNHFNYVQAIGAYCDNYVDKEDKKRFREAFAKDNIIKELQHKERITLRYRSVPNADGQKYFEAQIVRLRRNNFDYKVLVGFRHIDELVAAEQANAAKTEFLSQVAHDIRTPLNAILGFVEIAKNELDDKEQVAYALEKITSSGRYLTELVNDVLDLSKIERGQLELHPEKISLKDFFDKLSQSFLLRSKVKQLQVSYHQHDILHDCVFVDVVRLRQILTNIVSNAIKYTPNGGSIKVEMYEEQLAGSKVRLVTKVTDTGIGMSAEFMQHMYEHFLRATDIRVSHTNGHGLGLAIVKELVDAMAGKIEVASELGKGTSFCLTFDLPYFDVAELKQPESEGDYGALCAGMHLLVAEDNKLNYEVVSVLLGMQKITCERAENGAVCVEKFTSAPAKTYDAVLMDMQMPVMDGLLATQAIRKSSHPEAQTIPIIAMTANAFSDDIKKCLAAGMQAHLSKPLDMPKLLKVLAQYR